MSSHTPPYTILVTGATGYLGSVLCTNLCRDHRVIGLFMNPPSNRLQSDAPGVEWKKGDVVEPGCMECIFKKYSRLGHPVNYIIHLAAFTDYGEKWQDEYSDTNVIGTRNIIEAALDAGVKRVLFAGSIAALEPPLPGEVLTEKTATYANVAYSKSKAMGELLLSRYSDKIPVIILRLGGVFTDWCELPPLFSVMNLWSLPFFGRVVPGRGESGFPYIHRKDVVRMVKKIVAADDLLDRFEVLFAAPSGCTYQKELFPVIRRACGQTYCLTPLNVSPDLAKIMLHAKYMFNTLMGKKTYERAWMVRYVDRPLVVDTTYTENRLKWKPSSDLHILKKLPALMAHFRQDHAEWLRRNINRNDQQYEYFPD